MKGIETGKDKVKKICEVLRNETIEPAKKEADQLIEEARLEAEGIIAEANERAEVLLEQAKKEIERQKKVSHATLQQASRQTLEDLKQQIEQKLINPELASMITKNLSEPKILHELIQAVVEALGKEGIDADLSVYIPATVPAKTVNELLGQKILSKLKEKSVLLGKMAGGIEVKLRNENISIDITDQAIKELVSNYIRKDFREMFFG